MNFLTLAHLVSLPGAGHLGGVHVSVCRLQLHLGQARLDAVVVTNKVPEMRNRLIRASNIKQIYFLTLEHQP